MSQPQRLALGKMVQNSLSRQKSPFFRFGWERGVFPSPQLPLKCSHRGHPLHTWGWGKDFRGESECPCPPGPPSLVGGDSAQMAVTSRSRKALNKSYMKEKLLSEMRNVDAKRKKTKGRRGITSKKKGRLD